MIGPTRIVPAGHAPECRFRTGGTARTAGELDTERCPRCAALAKYTIQIQQRARRHQS